MRQLEILTVALGCSILALCFCNPKTASAEALSQEALYYRCYGHLVRGRPQANDARLAAVRSGQSTAVAACMDLLNVATLDAQGMLQSRSGESFDPVAQAILKTLQDFHGLWFPANDFNELPYDDPNYDIYDIGEMALHVTQALLSPGAVFSDIVTTKRTFEAVRATPRAAEYLIYWPTAERLTKTMLRADSRRFSTGVGSTWHPTLVQFGKLVGIRKIPLRRDVLSHTSGGRLLDLDIHQPLGGGVIGTIPFLLLNTGRFEKEHADGGLIMARRWSKAVLKDVLCRDLPVLRATDAIPLVEAEPKLPFRGSHTCMQCHGTMDGMAGVIRQVELARTAPGPGDYTFHVTKHIVANPTLASDDPLIPEVSFDRRPPHGRVFFRDLNGDLIDEEVVGLDQLGAFLRDHIDLYACAAKRYYAFFTGVDVSLYDPGEPSRGQASTVELIHRQQVLELAALLQKEQSLSNMVRRIISLPIYSSRSYQVPE